MQGASGELAPAEQYSGDTALADRHGRELGYAALSTLEGMGPPDSTLRYIEKLESGAPLAIWKRGQKEMSVKLKASSVEIELGLKDILKKDEIEQLLKAADDGFERERLWRKAGVCSNFSNTGETVEKFWVWQLGDSFLVSHPFDAYSYLQQLLRQAFPKQAIAVGNLSNGGLGYLPPKECYDRNLYTVWQTPFARGGLEKLIEAERTALQKFISEVEK